VYFRAVEFTATRILLAYRMNESSHPFDSNGTSAEIISNWRSGQLLNWLAKNRAYRRDDQYQTFCDDLIALHNSGEINLVASVVLEHFEPSSERSFWLLQDLLCALLPKLEANAEDMMQAVEKLVELGGEDLAASRPNGALREWLAARPEETQRLLQITQDGVQHFSSLTFILEAGARNDIQQYHAAAIKFLASDNTNTQRAAITALARIGTTGFEHLQTKGLDALITYSEFSASTEDAVSAIGALLEVHARAPSNAEKEVISALTHAGTKPSSSLHFVLARALANHHDCFSEELQSAIIKLLASADPSMKGVVDQIDFALSRCFSVKNRLEVANCLEQLICHNETPLDIQQLDSLLHSLTSEHQKDLGWLVVHWLRFGSHSARLQLGRIFSRFFEEGYELNPDLSGFGFSDEELVFVSRKALGYFIFEASTAASILICFLQAAKSPAAAESIASLLFDPLMINFSGKARETVDRHTKLKGTHRRFLRSAIKKHDEYLASMRAVGEVPELRPSSLQLSVEAERQRKQAAQIAREAERQSIFANLITRQVILFGEGSIDYVRDGSGMLRRSVSMLSSFGTTMEIPRLNVIDPVYLQHIVFTFRREEFPQ